MATSKNQAAARQKAATANQKAKAAKNRAMAAKKTKPRPATGQTAIAKHRAKYGMGKSPTRVAKKY
jgi:hypothetical protein